MALRDPGPCPLRVLPTAYCQPYILDLEKVCFCWSLFGVFSEDRVPQLDQACLLPADSGSFHSFPPVIPRIASCPEVGEVVTLSPLV